LFRKWNKLRFFPLGRQSQGNLQSVGVNALSFSAMQSDAREAVLVRLQFAMAELEVIVGIADAEGEAALLEKTRTLAERMRECIEAVSRGNVGWWA
jgi:hypothetical protein